MTTDRDIAPVIRSWLRDEPDGSAGHVLDAALAIVESTPQHSAARWSVRRPTMNTIVRLGVAAAVLAMAVALGYSLTQNIGDPDPAPAPDAPHASDDASPPVAALPAELTHLFIGATRDVPGIEVDDRLAIDLTARTFRLHTSHTRRALFSAARVPEPGVLRLETLIRTTECAEGDVGTYRYSLSPRGTVLTVASGDDDCAPRADALVGEWRRSECRGLGLGDGCLGELEAGSQASLFFDPYLHGWPRLGQQTTPRYGAMTYKVPDGWANSADASHVYTLMRAGAYGAGASTHSRVPPDSVWFGARPQAARAGCGRDHQPDASVGTSAKALADWVRAHPGLELVSEFVNPGWPGSGITTKYTLDVVASESYAEACMDSELDGSFVPLFTHPGYTYGIGTGDRHRLIVFEIDADTAMLIGIDTLEPGDIDAFVDEVGPILDSIRLVGP